MTNWTQNIKDLRIRLEANVETLKKLEKIGTDEAVHLDIKTHAKYIRPEK